CIMDDSTLSQIFQKPDTVDTPIYEKPNAYDEEPAIVITASRHNSRSSRMTVDSFKSRYFQRRGPTAISCLQTPPSSTMTSPTTGTYYSANTPNESPPLSPKSVEKKPLYNSQIDYNQITSFVLSQAIPTTQTHFNHHHEDTLTVDTSILNPSSPKNSIIGVDSTPSTDIAAAAAALLSNDSGIVSSFLLQRNRSVRTNITPTATHKKLVPKQNSNVIVYSFRKKSLNRPNQHEIYLHIDHPDEDDEDVMIYRKVQPYSFFWSGFHSMLYSNLNDGQGIKVAEARRGAFDAKISIESADYNDSLIEDIYQPHIQNLRGIRASNNIHCQNLTQRSQSNILFEYEIWFHGSRMRWKRPSLLSHDFTCEIKLTGQDTKLLQQQRKKRKSYKLPQKKKYNGFIDSDSDNDEDDHDHHTHKTCRRWKLIAEFDSHSMSDLDKEFGKLSIDLDILNQVEKERCNLLEANIVMTCCTLIDQIRSVMGK
ncbi:hypothetical protein HPULCUR_008679, partial [Helicostylum pulchrum]